MKTLILIFFISITLFAQSIRPSMMPVTQESPRIIQDLASGVCSLGSDNTGSACCTGFKIGPNQIMTNFHCLACANNLFQKIVGATPFMMMPAPFLYSLGNAPLSKREEIMKRVNLDPEMRAYNLNANDIPKNDDELKTLLNSLPEQMNYINFETYLGNTDLQKSAIRILSIEQASDRLDYAILNVEKINTHHHSFELKSKGISNNKRIGIIGHPHLGPNPDKKAYDITDNCKINSAIFDSPIRDSVFSHHCDTYPGNSGSPIIERSSGKVIGIHWGKNSAFNVNLGVDMSAIIQDLSKTSL